MSPLHLRKSPVGAMHTLEGPQHLTPEGEQRQDSRQGRQDRHKTGLQGYRALRGRVSAEQIVPGTLAQLVYQITDPSGAQIQRYWAQNEPWIGINAPNSEKVPGTGNLYLTPKRGAIMTQGVSRYLTLR